jgi:hypothetical protein
MNENNSLDTTKQIGTALALILYPFCAGIAFAVHPNLLSLSIDPEVSERIAEFHGNTVLHAGHVLMIIAVPLLITIAIHFMNKLQKRAPWWGFIGGILAICGAVILAVDKGALCLVTSAFDTLPQADFQNLYPGIEAMFHYRGWLWILQLLPLLPLGFIIQTMALVRTKIIPRRGSIPMLIGSILMANPDIDIIGLVATIFLASGFIPYGIRLIQRAIKASRVRLVPVGEKL